MDYHTISNPAIDLIDLKDKIYEKITKAKAVISCIMFAVEFVRDEVEIDNHTLYHALWVVDEYLDDLKRL